MGGWTIYAIVSTLLRIEVLPNSYCGVRFRDSSVKYCDVLHRVITFIWLTNLVLQPGKRATATLRPSAARTLKVLAAFLVSIVSI